ncbi:MAG: hypothetical protein ACSNEK_09635 [Parachlamydiaceae bacterium]
MPININSTVPSYFPQFPPVNEKLTENEQIVAIGAFGKRAIMLRKTSDPRISCHFAILNISNSTIKVDAEFLKFMQKHKITQIAYKKAEGEIVYLSNYKFQSLTEKEAEELSRAVNALIDSYALLRANEREKEPKDKNKPSSRATTMNGPIKPQNRATLEKPKVNRYIKIFTILLSQQEKEDKVSEEKAIKRHKQIEQEEQDNQQREEKVKEDSLNFAFRQELVKQGIVKRSKEI